MTASKGAIPATGKILGMEVRECPDIPEGSLMIVGTPPVGAISEDEFMQAWAKRCGLIRKAAIPAEGPRRTR